MLVFVVVVADMLADSVDSHECPDPDQLTDSDCIVAAVQCTQVVALTDNLVDSIGPQLDIEPMAVLVKGSVHVPMVDVAVAVAVFALAAV